jgi:ATP-dependent exoDNAse (exonuclease V) alpha subunit
MANFHLEFEPISREQGRSPVGAATYQSGEKLRDDYYGRTHYNYRQDVLHKEIMLPANAPLAFFDRQTLWREVDRAEKRSDARTARRAFGSLPNEREFSVTDYIEIVREYITDNFINMGMCADIAIHYVRNADDPAKDNPHVHILLTDKPVNQDGFCQKKNRDWNKRTNVRVWREQWANVQNKVYERKGLKVTVSHKNYIEQGIFDREPKRYLSRKDMWLERNGIRTIRGDENRDKKRNQDREHNHVRSR